MPDLVDLFNTGGIPLVIVAAFLWFLRWFVRYFVKQTDSQTEERKELVDKFDEMLNTHCKMVTASLTTQGEAFHSLIEQLEGISKAMTRQEAAFSSLFERFASSACLLDRQKEKALLEVKE